MRAKGRALPAPGCAAVPASARAILAACVDAARGAAPHRRIPPGHPALPRSNKHNRRTNHSLAAFHSYASWGVVAPAVAGARWLWLPPLPPLLLLLLLLLPLPALLLFLPAAGAGVSGAGAVLRPQPSTATQRPRPPHQTRPPPLLAPPAPPAVLLRLLLWAAATLLLPTQQVYGGPAQGGPYLWLRAFGLDARPWWSLASLAAFCASLAYLVAAGQWMTGEGGAAGGRAAAGRGRRRTPAAPVAAAAAKWPAAELELRAAAVKGPAAELRAACPTPSLSPNLCL